MLPILISERFLFPYKKFNSNNCFFSLHNHPFAASPHVNMKTWQSLYVLVYFMNAVQILLDLLSCLAEAGFMSPLHVYEDLKKWILVGMRAL